MSDTQTAQQVIDALMAKYGGTPLTPARLPAHAGFYYMLADPARSFCIPALPVTTPATDPTAWATACIAAAALTQVA